MTFDELRDTLAAAVAGGKIGTPVSLRIHWQTTAAQAGSQAGAWEPENSRAELTTLFAAAMQLADSLFHAEASRLMVRQHASGQQLSVLVNHAGGQTALVSVGKTSAPGDELHLLAIGNHGVMRLEGGELIEQDALSCVAPDDRWKLLADKCLQQTVPLEISP